MKEKYQIWLLCIAIIIASLIIGLNLREGLEALGQYINDGLSVIAQSLGG